MSDAAEEILLQLESAGWPGVLNLVTDERSESLHLDFKLKRNPELGRFDRDDRQNLSIALSGFANSDGGVIVWGIDARRVEEFDRAVGLRPLKDVRHALSELAQLTSEMVSPLVPRVRHIPILDPEVSNAGVILTVVPVSDRAPHMATAKDLQRYYRRSGSSFRALEHYEIADLFGRRPHPVLHARSEWQSSSDFGFASGVTYHLMIRVIVTNKGRGVARFPAITLGYPRGWKTVSKRAWSEHLVRVAAPRDWWERHAGGTDSVVFPDDEFDAVVMVIDVAEGELKFSELVVPYKVVAADAQPIDGEIRISGGDIR